MKRTGVLENGHGFLSTSCGRLERSARLSREKKSETTKNQRKEKVMGFDCTRTDQGGQQEGDGRRSRRDSDSLSFGPISQIHPQGSIRSQEQPIRKSLQMSNAPIGSFFISLTKLLDGISMTQPIRIGVLEESYPRFRNQQKPPRPKWEHAPEDFSSKTHEVQRMGIFPMTQNKSRHIF